MKQYHNMTGEGMPFTSGERVSINYQKVEEKKVKTKDDSRLTIWDFIVFAIFALSFFGSIYLYFQNRTLKHEIEQKHLLIMDLQKLYSKTNGK